MLVSFSLAPAFARPTYTGVKALAAFVTGRRTKWVVVALWIVLAAIFAGPGSKLADETNNQTQSFLPDSAESTKVLELQNDRFASRQTRDALIVYRREGGLTAADKRKIERDAELAQRMLPTVGLPVTPFGAGAPRGPRGSRWGGRLHRRHRSRTTTTSWPTGARTCARSSTGGARRASRRT